MYNENWVEDARKQYNIEHIDFIRNRLLKLRLERPDDMKLFIEITKIIGSLAGLKEDLGSGIDNDWQTNEVSLQDDLFSALTMCLDALYEAVDIAPLDRLPTKAPAAIQQAQYTLNKVDGGSR